MSETSSHKKELHDVQGAQSGLGGTETAIVCAFAATQATRLSHLLENACQRNPKILIEL
jgi:hypothetical protein